MKSYVLSIIVIVLFSITGYAQAYEGTAEYGKKKQQVVMIDYAFPPEAVENAIVQKIEKEAGSAKQEKGLFNKDKGFYVFNNSFIADISEKRMDYAVKVERKSRKEKDEATISLVMMKDGVNALSTMEASEVAKAKNFLNNLGNDVEEAYLELQIRDQEELVIKSEKKFKEMQSDKTDLEKKLKKLGEDIEKQQKDIESQRTSLDGLKGKRKVATP